MPPFFKKGRHSDKQYAFKVSDLKILSSQIQVHHSAASSESPDLLPLSEDLHTLSNDASYETPVTVHSRLTYHIHAYQGS